MCASLQWEGQLNLHNHRRDKRMALHVVAYLSITFKTCIWRFASCLKFFFYNKSTIATICTLSFLLFLLWPLNCAAHFTHVSPHQVVSVRLKCLLQWQMSSSSSTVRFLGSQFSASSRTKVNTDTVWEHMYLIKWKQMILKVIVKYIIIVKFNRLYFTL